MLSLNRYPPRTVSAFGSVRVLAPHPHLRLPAHSIVFNSRHPSFLSTINLSHRPSTAHIWLSSPSFAASLPYLACRRLFETYLNGAEHSILFLISILAAVSRSEVFALALPLSEFPADNAEFDRTPRRYNQWPPTSPERTHLFSHIKDLIIGPALPTQAATHERLNKVRALAAFSPDALSSIAYANQEIYLGLVIAGAAGLAYAWPIGIAIATLLILVALSYYQTIHAYPSGGGSYIVARSNLGILPGLTAAAALLIDYLLNAAVSLTAGVAAIGSAFPFLLPYRVEIALFLLLVITLLNLRGAQETGTAMAVPVYFFIVTYLLMIAVGFVRLAIEGPTPPESVHLPALAPVTIFLVLHAFSTGSTALTGVEAISNGVPAFQPPEAKNAGRTLLVMAFLMGILFVGTIALTHFFAVIAAPEETILSALARRIVGTSVFYYIIQFATLAILTVAANTSFAGFPRLAAILARDTYLPRQLGSLGDRLGFTNGIILLSLGTAALIILFSGDTHALVPLFAIGAFLAFTLSQAGMVLHWWRADGRGWTFKSAINGIGALATGTTLVVVAFSKFLSGAWITILLIPTIVIIFVRVHRHYQQVRNQLSLHGLPPSLRPVAPARVVVPVSGVHRGMVNAVLFAQSISSDVTGVYVELEPGAGDAVREEWAEWWPDLPLVVVPSPYRSLVGPLLQYLDKTDLEHNDGQLAVVVLPEFVTAHWWQNLLHNQTAGLIKAALLYGRRRSGGERLVVDVPYHLRT
jgi:amino acid transporter